MSQSTHHPTLQHLLAFHWKQQSTSDIFLKYEGSVFGAATADFARVSSLKKDENFKQMSYIQFLTLTAKLAIHLQRRYGLQQATEPVAVVSNNTPFMLMVSETRSFERRLTRR